MMKYVTFLFISLLAQLLLLSCSDNDNEYVDTELSMDEVVYSYRQGQYSDIVLPYRKAVIATGVEKPALVIYLHGGSSKGSDNETQIKEKAVGAIAGYLASRHISSVLIVPQCPKNMAWGGKMNGVLKALIDDCVSEYMADACRIYILGGSMGGTGTWSMLSDYPGLFAAAMSVAGNPTGSDAVNVSRTPVLTVMGTHDEIMDISLVRNFSDLVASLCGEVLLETENGWTHEMTCTDSYTDNRLDWVFRHINTAPL